MVKLNGGIEFVVKQTAPTATARSTLEVEKYIEDTLSSGWLERAALTFRNCGCCIIAHVLSAENSKAILEVCRETEAGELQADPKRPGSRDPERYSCSAIGERVLRGEGERREQGRAWLPAAQDSISMSLTCACSPRSVECPAHLNKRRHAYIEWAGKLRACLFTTWLLLDRDPSTKSRSTHLQERQTPSRRFSCQSNIYLMQTETRPNNVYVNTRLA